MLESSGKHANSQPALSVFEVDKNFLLVSNHVKGVNSLRENLIIYVPLIYVAQSSSSQASI